MGNSRRARWYVAGLPSAVMPATGLHQLYIVWLRGGGGGCGGACDSAAKGAFVSEPGQQHSWGWLLSLCPSVCLSVCLPVCLSACLPVCLSACLSALRAAERQTAWHHVNHAVS